MNAIDEHDEMAMPQTVSLDGVWMIGNAHVVEEIGIIQVDGEIAEKLTRPSATKFNEADVRKPLASAVQVVEAGNRIIMEENEGYIENKKTGERMMMRVEQNMYVRDVQLEDGSIATVTMDSGAGCCVWTRGKYVGRSKLTPRQPGAKMVAANGTEIG
jgi:hypothetical protein